MAFGFLSLKLLCQQLKQSLDFLGVPTARLRDITELRGGGWKQINAACLLGEATSARIYIPEHWMMWKSKQRQEKMVQKSHPNLRSSFQIYLEEC